MLSSVKGLFRRPRERPGTADTQRLAPRVVETREPERAPPPAAALDAPPARLDWPPERLAVADALWGKGFSLPGGEEEVLRLAMPLGLSAACSVLLLGCGAGGPARCLAERLGTWVSGFEHDAGLVAAAARHCAATDLGRRARIKTWDPTAPRFPARAYHHALALEPLGQGKAGIVLPAIATALRTNGNFVLVEAVAGGTATGEAPPLTDWVRSEHREPPLTEGAITRTLEELGFDLRVIEDITERHIQLMVRGWRDLVEAMVSERPTPSRAAPVVREAERWLRRARLMRSGELRLMRWHVIARETG